MNASVGLGMNGRNLTIIYFDQIAFSISTKKWWCFDQEEIGNSTKSGMEKTKAEDGRSVAVIAKGNANIYSQSHLIASPKLQSKHHTNGSHVAVEFSNVKTHGGMHLRVIFICCNYAKCRVLIIGSYFYF